MYEHNLECSWTILAEQSKIIQLFIFEFELEMDSWCRFDKIKVRTVVYVPVCRDNIDIQDKSAHRRRLVETFDVRLIKYTGINWVSYDHQHTLVIPWHRKTIKSS